MYIARLLPYRSDRLPVNDNLHKHPGAWLYLMFLKMLGR